MRSEIRDPKTQIQPSIDLSSDLCEVSERGDEPDRFDPRSTARNDTFRGVDGQLSCYTRRVTGIFKAWTGRNQGSTRWKACRIWRRRFRSLQTYLYMNIRTCHDTSPVATVSCLLCPAVICMTGRFSTVEEGRSTRHRLGRDQSIYTPPFPAGLMLIQGFSSMPARLWSGPRCKGLESRRLQCMQLRC